MSIDLVCVSVAIVSQCHHISKAFRETDVHIDDFDVITLGAYFDEHVSSQAHRDLL